MKQKQQIEIDTLDKIIQDSLSLQKWDGLRDGAKGMYADDKVKYVEGSPERIHPESIYFKINGGGKLGYITGDINEKIRINKLLKAKERYDLSMTTWISDIQEGLLSINELREDGWSREADIIAGKFSNPYRELNDIEKSMLNNRKQKLSFWKKVSIWFKNLFHYFR